MIRFAVAVLVTACSTQNFPTLDGGGSADAPVDVLADAALDAPAPYRHTITIDGVDDFAVVDQLATTSTGYVARLAWDAQFVYVGYGGPDLDPAALDTGFKWLFVYLDVDPGAGTGATSSQGYNTQQAQFPTGFGAEFYARWKCDGSVASIEQYAGTWAGSVVALTTGQAGSFVELAIPRSVLGGSTTFGLVTWMINEKSTFEGSFAGLYPGNFVDGYAATLPITRYLRADLTSPRPPNDPVHEITP